MNVHSEYLGGMLIVEFVFEFEFNEALFFSFKSIFIFHGSLCIFIMGDCISINEFAWRASQGPELGWLSHLESCPRL